MKQIFCTICTICAIFLTFTFISSTAVASNGVKLINDKTVSGLSANQGQWLYFYIDVPKNSEVTVKIDGTTGDADLYTRFDADPTESTYDMRPYTGGSVERCTYGKEIMELSTTDKRLYIGLRGYTAFSNVSLTASYKTRIINDQQISSLSANKGEWLYYYIDVPKNSDVTVKMNGTTGDADLYTRFDDKPTESLYDSRPYLSSSVESCTYTNTASSRRLHIGLRGYTAFSSVSLVVTCDTRLVENQTITNLSATKGETLDFYINTKKIPPRVAVKTSGGVGNVDLFVINGSYTAYDSSESAGNNEHVTFNYVSNKNETNKIYVRLVAKKYSFGVSLSYSEL
jgi:hypothetical protein